MSRLVWAQLRHRPGRTLGLLLAMLAATTGFTVLTGSTTTSRLGVVGTVRANYRGAYDILVRPKGARTAPERDHGLVAGNTLSGTFGGITVQQWQRIRQITGVEVAAPIAMVGTVTNWNVVETDLTDLVDRRLTRQLLRVNLTWYADRDLTRGRDEHTGLVYVSKRPLVGPVGSDRVGDPEAGEYTDGVARRADVCHSGVLPPYEIQEDGRVLPLCLPVDKTRDWGSAMPNQYAQLLSNGTFRYVRGFSTWPGQDPHRLKVQIRVPLALLLAGIDPDQEAALVGLDRAVTRGRYLLSDGEVTRYQDTPDSPVSHTLPVLLASRLELDERGSIDAARVGVNGGLQAGLTTGDVRRVIAGNPLATARRQVSAQDAYREFADHDPADPATTFTNHLMVSINAAFRSSQPSVTEQAGGVLRPRPQTPAYDAMDSPDCPVTIPWLAHDVAYRPVAAVCHPLPVASQNTDNAQPVGVFDAAKLRRFNDLVQVPLESYYAPRAPGADAASRKLLGDRPLLPNDNPGNYLAPSPALFTTIGALRDLGASADLISAVRVRAAGITGFDPANRERVRLIAEDIAKATGLDVDIMIGASPAPQTVDLPAGRYGRPGLALAETWTKMGVAAAILRAVDRKSVALFVLILIVCALFVANATGSAVRDRRRELAVLACLGWPGRRLAVPVLVEVGVVGLVAGALSLAVSPPAAGLVGAHLTWSHALLAVPIAVALALSAAAVPAARAARAHPLAAVRTVAAPVRRRPRRHRTLATLAWSNLGRVAGRTALAVLALAVAVAALTLLAAVLVAFHGSLVGTMLGDAVSIRIRGVDAAAIIATVVLATVAVADVLYLGVRERASELAALQATGWSTLAVARLVGHEAVAIGALAALLGASAGLAGAAALAGTLPGSLLVVAAGAAGSGLVLAGLAAVVPAVLLRRIPTTVLLCEE